MDAKKTGELIASLRREQDMKQSELAERIGVTNKAISRWETGRGYPDIETLPKLAEALNISIPELLQGERLDQSAPLHPLSLQTELDHSIETVCQYAGQQTKRQKKKIKLLRVLLAALIVFFSLITVILRFLPTALDLYMAAEELLYSSTGFYWSIVGSPDCVIAADYKSLKYLGKTYIPLPVNGYAAVEGEIMVEECQVEGAGFLGKLLFGETLYEVKNVPNQELVYLQTDYDFCISRYFVLETEYDRYSQLMKEAVFENYYATYFNESSYYWDRPIGTELAAAICDAAAGVAIEESVSGNGVMVYCFDENHCFYYYAGCLIDTENGYYWEPVSHCYDVSPGWIYTDQYYPITGLDDELAALFSK